MANVENRNMKLFQIKTKFIRYMQLCLLDSKK